MDAIREQAGELLRRHVAAARRLRKPLLVQRGWAGFSAEDLAEDVDAGDLFFIDEAPHDWLFARACCAIQHGGIGSLARALRQGCPVLVEPFGNDQFINAELVKALGFGAALDSPSRSGEDIARVIFDRVLPDGVRQRAAELGQQLRDEDGLQDACCRIDRWLERRQSGRDGRSRWWSGVWTLAAPLPDPEPLLPRAQPATRDGEAPAELGEPIPRILHQTFSERQIPEPYRAWHETWKTHHPDWQFRLWIDADCRRLIAQDYPWFLEVYDGYTDPRMRAEAARYFILHRHGGVYVDLDYEALRPLEPLLQGRGVVLTSEPPAHLQARHHHSLELISNAFLASVPGHAFWLHVFDALRSWRRAPESFAATGPGLLTRVVERFPGQVERPARRPAGDAGGRVELPPEGAARRSSLTIEASELLCPLSRIELEATPSAEIEQIIRRQAYAVHHWYGGWGLESPAANHQARVDLLFGGRQSPISYRVTADLLAADPPASPLPLISCLMVTRDRPLLARRAIDAFKRQTYAEKELVIVEDGPGSQLSDWLRDHPHPRIRYFREPDTGQTLGALRNIAVRHARGEYLAQWDDDDLSAPPRLERQMAMIHHFRVDACLLQRQLVWRPGDILVKSVRRLWEGSALVPKAMMPLYPEVARGEDTPAIEQLVSRARVAWLDMPELYLYIHHGTNTFGSDHWQPHFDLATERFQGPRYRPMLRDVQAFFEVDLERIERDFEQRAREPISRSVSPATPRDERPTVLVLTLIRDGARHLPGYLRRLCETSYPNEKLSLAFLDSDRLEESDPQLQALLPEWRQTFARVEFFEKDESFRAMELSGLELKSDLARRRNTLLQKALRDERWVLWMDVGLAAYPPQVIDHLLAVRKRIVVPNCLTASGEEPFDRSTFKLSPDAANLDRKPHRRGGLQPPSDADRLYLTDLRHETLVELDGVGGSMLLIDADLHRDGLIFPPFPYEGLIETEGLARMARDMGTECWGMPNLVIYHA